MKPEAVELPGEISSEEESELPGQKRPPKGTGWWGTGPPLSPAKKGMLRNFVDGAGLCSPCRWAINSRVLPDDFVAKRLRKILLDGPFERD